MTALNVETWNAYAQATAFLGNTLLKPITQTSPIGLDPAFWAGFPDFGSKEVCSAADDCAAFVESLAGLEPEQAERLVSVEYTRLFVGPPSPAAAPWETVYRSENATCGFGEATFEMRHLLREAGLQLSNESNQYEDHMGIELLYVSVLCQRVADALAAGEEDTAERLANQVRVFASERPASWIGALIDRVEEAFPNGYFSCVLRLSRETLKVLIDQS